MCTKVYVILGTFWHNKGGPLLLTSYLVYVWLHTIWYYLDLIPSELNHMSIKHKKEIWLIFKSTPKRYHLKRKKTISRLVQIIALMKVARLLQWKSNVAIAGTLGNRRQYMGRTSMFISNLSISEYCSFEDLNFRDVLNFKDVSIFAESEIKLHK